MTTYPRSSLGRITPEQPADREHLQRMAMAAFHRHGLLIIDLNALEADSWLAKALVAWGEERYGKRGTRHVSPTAI